MSLTNTAQTAIVVGASRGLGRGIATALAEAGTPVVAVGATGRPCPSSRLRPPTSSRRWPTPPTPR